MLYSYFLVCVVQLALALPLLFAFGRRLRIPHPGGGRVAPGVAAALSAALLSFFAAVVASDLWDLSSAPAEAAEITLTAVAVAVIVLRPDWNAIGQIFFASYVTAAATYLAFAAWVTVAANLSPVASAASAMLFVLEFAALVLSSSFTFETCDVLCRTRHSRQLPVPDPGYHPMVSLHIAAYNEPPEMLIETIARAESIDYPDFEVVVIDNNTEDPGVYGPVEEYCRDRPRLRFVHVSPWPGYKSGALNLALHRLTDPRAELVGVIDADYLVSPDYLAETAGYFADPRIAFVQTPQDYREFEGSRYFTALYDAYRYFFAMAMPSRNERNSIIFAGTMGLLRRSALQQIGGWDEWCITEDADTSLRLLRNGWSGVFVSRSFGRGIMPLTFSSLKSQRFRWCFGGMQILRRHWRSLMPWDRSAGNQLSIAQRLDYLLGGLQWLNDLVYLLFTGVLLIVAGLLLAGDHVAVRPLVGPTILLPAALLASGLLRALWALRQRARITVSRAVLAFATWLALSWTVALACVQGLLRSEGVFLRTPKTSEGHRVRAALWAARSEVGLATLLWVSCVALAVAGTATPLLIALLAWQGTIYASSPLLSLMNQRTQLTPELERRRHSEDRRERFARAMRRAYVGSLAATALGSIFVVVLAIGASHPGQPVNPFQHPERTGADRGLWGGVLQHPSPKHTPSSVPGHGGTSTTTSVPSSSSGSTGAPSTTTATTAITSTTSITSTTVPVTSSSTSTSTPSTTPSSTSVP